MESDATPSQIPAFHFWPWGHGYTKCCRVPFTSCDPWTWEVWSGYVKWLKENAFFDLDIKVTQNIAQHPLHHVTYLPAKVKVAKSYSLWRKHIIGPLTLTSGKLKKCQVLPTSCDLCSCKVWSCYIKRFKRRCIYMKIHYLTLTLGLRWHKMLPSTLYILWSNQIQSLKLLPPTVKEMHLQKIYYLTFVDTKCCPVPSTSCDLIRYKVWSCYVKWFKWKVMPSTLYFMWPMQLQSLKLLCLRV